jgi:hypothetical protein
VKIALQKQPSPRATMAALYPMRPAGSYTTPWDTILPLPFPQDLTRLPFFLARWSKQRNRETLAYLRSKYGIAPDDAGMADYADWLSERRKTWKNAGDVRLEQFVPIALSNGFLCVFVRFHSTRAGVFI